MATLPASPTAPLASASIGAGRFLGWVTSNRFAFRTSAGQLASVTLSLQAPDVDELGATLTEDATLLRADAATQRALLSSAGKYGNLLVARIPSSGEVVFTWTGLNPARPEEIVASHLAGLDWVSEDGTWALLSEGYTLIVAQLGATSVTFQSLEIPDGVLSAALSPSQRTVGFTSEFGRPCASTLGAAGPSEPTCAKVPFWNLAFAQRFIWTSDSAAMVYEAEGEASAGGTAGNSLIAYDVSRNSSRQLVQGYFGPSLTMNLVSYAVQP